MGGRFYLAAMLIAASIAAPAPAGAQTADGGKPLFDSRDGAPVRVEAPDDAAAIRARERLSARLGRQGVVDIDERTGTPRFVGRLDGYLTGPSTADPEQVVLDYVRGQRAVFGVADGDLAALRLTRRYSDASGITYLSWAQTWRGLSAFDNGLAAVVAADGRLISVAGSPLPDLGARSNEPGIGAGGALAEALDDAGTRGLAPRATQHGGAEQRTTFSGGHDARLVLFADGRGDVRLAWRVTADAGAGEVYDDVVDADSGELLFRHNTVDFAAGQVHAYPNHPGAGTNALRDVPVTDGSALSGPNAHVYPDTNDNDLPDSEIDATPPTGTTWNDSCTVCSWDPAVASSWQTNLRANGTQAYYLVNEFHDWLKNDPNIAFTSGTFDGDDPLKVEILDGAAGPTGGGLPNTQHRNNANMETPADGTSPRMQLYLFDQTNPAVNGGDDAGVVFHEYTHGLSHRLSHGLNSLQSDAMGEGWSDWYALDYLVQHGLETDGPAANDLQLATYLFPGGLRSQGTDCRPADVADCPGLGSAGAGGYTYGDFGRVAPPAAEHDNGEIWGQTLWDLRTAIGAPDARRLITTGMRLSVANPSMLEMRNAILQADTAAFAGAHRDALWRVFATRGMGFSAVSFGGNDRRPVESFAPAPAPGSGGTVSGRVTDKATGAPVAGALVQLASTASGFPGAISAVTDSTGRYSIADVPPAAYPRTFVDAPGYTPGVEAVVQVPVGGRTLDLTLARDYAASSGGARIAGFDGPDYTSSSPSCGPRNLIDLSYLTGWGSTSHNGTHGPVGAKSVTIELPRTVDVSAFNIDPGAVCGDDDSASTRDYRIETSGDGTTFAPAASGRFNSGNNHRANVIVAPAGTDGVRYVRYTMLTPQRQTGSDSGVDWMDTTEFEVYGVPEGFGRAAPPSPPPISGGANLTAVDRTAPTLGLALVAGQRLKAVLAKGMKLRVSCDEGCSLTVTAQLDARVAKRLKLLPRRSRAKSVVVATGSLPLGGGPRIATLRFTAAASKRLAGTRSVRLSLGATASDASGNEGKRTVAVTVRR
jgi:hypothetical protein